MTEQRKANDLDTRISHLQAGEPPQTDTAFAAELVALAEDIRPNAAFVADLKARLRTVTISHEKKETVMQMSYRNTPLIRLLAYTAAAAVALVALTLTVPPLRALAQEVLDNLFNRAPADTIAFETPITVDLRPTPIAQAAYATPGVLADAQAQVSFAIKAPVYVPEGYEFYSASVDAPGLVTLSYVRDGYMLNISQSRVADAQAFEVGATADIQVVEINGIPAEYVEGYWFIEIERTGERTGDQGELRERVWDGTGNYQQMRWQKDGIVYWMHSVIGSSTDLPLEEWVAVAESLQ